MLLHSYFSPALDAGDYDLSIQQTLTDGKDAISPLATKKSFTVVAPRFSLPADNINSIYPPQGHSQEARVLPHIIFNDPHLPWERRVGRHQKGDISRIPWLALMVFTKDELETIKFETDDKTATAREPTSATMSFQVPLAALKKRTDISSPNFEDDELSSDQIQEDNANFIFLKTNRFCTLFGDQTSDGKDPTTISLERFKYFAHIRHVNIEGTSFNTNKNASDTTTQPFGVVFSHRSGPVEIQEPDTLFVHLISLDGINKNIKSLPLQSSVSYVALVSLHSWTYRCTPEGHITYRDMMEHLNNNLKSGDEKSPRAPLRRSDLIGKLAGNKDTSSVVSKHSGGKVNWLQDRLEAGYTFVRHRTFSGEQTVAMYKGPLVPHLDIISRVSPISPSDSGLDLQIQDKQTGMVDLSYSIAWELGRSLALQDRGFTAAIMRLRGECHARAVASTGSLKSDVLSKLKETTLSGTSLADRAGPHSDASTSSRLRTMSQDVEETPRAPPAGLSKLKKGLSTQVREWLSKAVKAQIRIEKDASPPTVGETHHTDLPTSWRTVLSWIKDKLTLKGIPYLYMFPDPDVLPPEALRTFYIDDAWLDAVIDGGLSIANHMLVPNDPIKQEIKHSINSYLELISKEEHGLRAWLPRWGFVIRSELVHAYPNLKIQQVSADLSKKPENAAFARLADDVLFYVQQATPEHPQGNLSLKISQPHHHQRFSVGESITADEIKFAFKYFPTKENASKEDAKDRAKNADVVIWKPGVEQQPSLIYKPRESSRSNLEVKVLLESKIYDWRTRCLLIPQFPETCRRAINGVLGSPPSLLFNDREMEEPSAAFIGIQLSDDLLELELSYEKNSPNMPRSDLRQLYNPTFPSNDAESNLLQSSTSKTASQTSTDPLAPSSHTLSIENLAEPMRSETRSQPPTPSSGASQPEQFEEASTQPPQDSTGTEDPSSTFSANIQKPLNLAQQSRDPAPPVSEPVQPSLTPFFPHKLFRIATLNNAKRTIPSNTSPYDRMRPISTSQISKLCHPVLFYLPRDNSSEPPPPKNIPVPSRTLLDLVFSFRAISSVRQDLLLRSLTVYIPIGHISTDLLRPVFQRPEVRMLSRGKRWIAVASLRTEDLGALQRQAGVSSKDTALPVHPKKYLVMEVLPQRMRRGEERGSNLYTHPDLSFLLHSMEINDLPCEDIEVAVAERYQRAVEPSESVADGKGNGNDDGGSPSDRDNGWMIVPSQSHSQGQGAAAAAQTVSSEVSKSGSSTTMPMRPVTLSLGNGLGVVDAGVVWSSFQVTKQTCEWIEEERAMGLRGSQGTGSEESVEWV
ncbi:hypothetical protein MMC21_007946 [Puttea exsequens]|nr:hypothetical protein [Puttea exsequens]